MIPFVLDIETAPRTDAAAFLPNIEPPSNYKDPVKIDAYLVEKRQRQLEAAALSAETARILCVGLLRPGRDPHYVHCDDDESHLLREVWTVLGTRGTSEMFVTFNGSRFDWPMLIRRSFALGVPVPIWMPLDGRWPRRTHCDLLELWQSGDRTASISLDRLARLCGLAGKIGDGAHFAALWAQDRQAALDYLSRDLELTAELWSRMYPDSPNDQAR